MKIALLASAPSSCMLAPFGDPSWEIWACSPQNYKAPRIDAWFEMHSLDRKDVAGNEPYMAALTRHPRVYLSKEDHRLPYGVLYPKDHVLSQYHPMHHGFFSSSVAWMFAFALEQKPTHIGMWGIDMAAGNEYEYQRPGCHYFMGEALKRGIELVVPPQSDIMEVHPLYGYKEHWRSYWKMRARKGEIDERLRNLDNTIDAKNQERLQLMGARQSMEYEENTWLKP